MKTMYIECSMGAAGDMLTAALLELVDDRENVLQELNDLGIPGVEYKADSAEKCGIKGTSVRVLIHGEEEHTEDAHDHHHHDHHHHHNEHDHHDHHHGDHDHHDHDHDHGHHTHRSLSDVHEVVSRLPLSQDIKEEIIAVYGLIAEAESAAHGKPVDQIHFHEVGNMDAIADVTSVCYLMDKLRPDKVIVSPIHVGSGQVRCAHGIMPVPAPATAYILKGIPTYGGSVRGELCTPTGAALLRHFADEFGGMPILLTDRIGYGMGKKDFESANCVRVFLGELRELGELGELQTKDQNQEELVSPTDTDTIVELSCNVDDMTGEAVGYAIEALLNLGAREAFATGITMKKSRPGIMITVICSPEDKDKMIRGLYEHTTTIGIRETLHKRYILDREIQTLETSLGKVRKKVSRGYGVTRFKYEHDDLARIAREKKMSLDQVLARVQSEDR